MIDEKKLIDKLQQWHDDATEMSDMAITRDGKLGYDAEVFCLYILIDMINNGDFNHD